jgi:phage tail sheath protein FI
MLIVDPEPGNELSSETEVNALGLPTSTYSVTYYPWVRIANPFYNPDSNPAAARTLLASPAAMAAGLWAKTDGRRGVWKAPAGIEFPLLGAASLEYVVEDPEQDFLNPAGVNAIRRLPGFGPVVWGTRTRSTRANPEWRYVPVRRTAIFIEESIYNGIQWAVFEPNDHRLWASLRANIESFLNGLFRVGAFQGEKSSDAYFVRCGLGQTMTQGDIDRGQVIVARRLRAAQASRVRDRPHPAEGRPGVIVATTFRTAGDPPPLPAPAGHSKGDTLDGCSQCFRSIRTATIPTAPSSSRSW